MIDGFDPAKFREANNKNSKKNPQIPDNGIRVERTFGSASSVESRNLGATRLTTIEMPGVPSYDKTEKQLLASLEQELGVL